MNLFPISGQLKSTYTMSYLLPVTINNKKPPGLLAYMFYFSNSLFVSLNYTQYTEENVSFL